MTPTAKQRAFLLAVMADDWAQHPSHSVNVIAACWRKDWVRAGIDGYGMHEHRFTITPRGIAAVERVTA